MEEALNKSAVSVEKTETKSNIENTNTINDKSSIDNLENNVDENLKPTKVPENDSVFVDEFPDKKNTVADKVENNDTIFVDEYPGNKKTNLDSPLIPAETLDRSNHIEQKQDGSSRIPISKGTWSGEPGNSDWKPDNTYIPLKNNPDGANWKELKQPHNIDSITFKEGYPDFTPIAKAEVEIDNFTSKRYGKGANFDQADTKLAEQKGLTKEQIVQDRMENDFTWHEHENCKTMQLVPCEIHNNISHSGGISVIKQKNKI
ncbi:HNH endonuclease [Polaribacter sp. 20A6]|uniref:HNH endonuclease n=1 Tax=Polaribacter sp. 20A6 TaxID=2687289 RepID=UPI0013FDCF31|nr:HNH endonuclease [Polaribacter sp. 20A6]